MADIWRLAGEDIGFAVGRIFLLVIAAGCFCAVGLIIVGFNAWIDGAPFHPPLWLSVYATISPFLVAAGTWIRSLRQRVNSKTES